MKNCKAYYDLFKSTYDLFAPTIPHAAGFAALLAALLASVAVASPPPASSESLVTSSLLTSLMVIQTDHGHSHDAGTEHAHDETADNSLDTEVEGLEDLTAADQAAIAAVQKEYDATLKKWSDQLKEARVASGKYFTLPQNEAMPWKAKFEEAITEGNEQKALFEVQALKLFDLVPKPSDALYKVVLRINREQFERGLYEQCLELNSKLTLLKPEEKRVQLLHGSALAMLNRPDETIEFIRNSSLNSSAEAGAELIKSMHPDAFQNFQFLTAIKERWDREVELRKKEAEADDLPRVQIKTNRGTITVELFENEAPIAVNNFVALVEQGFYDGTIFHRVINHFMAQAGGYDESKARKSPGYSIGDEHHLPEARHHFRGSLCMARTQQPNSASAEFYLTFAPRPGLDGNYTVFGRVIAGWDVLDSLTRTAQMIADEEGAQKEVPILEAEPDWILKATVLRKREHEYNPQPYSGQ